MINGENANLAYRGAAPADVRTHAPWPVWKKVLGYALLAALSFAAIWFVDVKVHRPAMLPDESQQ